MITAMRDDDGFTVMEMLVAMVIGSIVLTSLMFVFLTGTNRAAQVGDRVVAAQSARASMDEVTTLLDAQTCQNGAPPIIDGQDNSITFYANRGGVDTDPTKYRLRYDSASRKLMQDTYTPTPDASGDPIYPTSPTSIRQVGESIIQTGASTSIFSYYAFTAAGTISTTALPTTLSATNLGKVVRVNVGFTVVPLRTKVDDGRSTDIQGQSIVDSADPNNPDNGPNC